MTCHTISDHEWDEGRIVSVGRHDVRGPYQEWERRCPCGRVQRWREWPREQAAGYFRLNPHQIRRQD